MFRKVKTKSKSGRELTPWNDDKSCIGEQNRYMATWNLINARNEAIGDEHKCLDQIEINIKMGFITSEDFRFMQMVIFGKEEGNEIELE